MKTIKATYSVEKGKALADRVINKEGESGGKERDRMNLSLLHGTTEKVNVNPRGVLDGEK